jgi:hypothetical protein
VTVDRKGDREDLATPARNQEDVGAPALVRRRLLDLAEVRPPAPPVDSWRQREPVPLHDPQNPLTIVAGAKGPIHHGPHAATATVARQMRAYAAAGGTHLPGGSVGRRTTRLISWVIVLVFRQRQKRRTLTPCP